MTAVAHPAPTAPVKASATRRTAAAGPSAAQAIWARRQRRTLYPPRLAVILTLLALTTTTAAVVALAVLLLTLARLIVTALARLVAAVAWRYRHRRLSPAARHHAAAERKAAEQLRQLRAEIATATTPRPAPTIEAPEAARWAQPARQLPPWPTTPTPPIAATAAPAQRPVVMTAPHYVQVPPPRHARGASKGFWSSPAGLLLGLKLLVLWTLLYIGLIGCFVTTAANHNTPTNAQNPTTQEPTP